MDKKDSQETVVPVENDRNVQIYEATTETLKSTTYIPEETFVVKRITGSEKILFMLYAMLLFIKLIETIVGFNSIWYLLNMNYLNGKAIFYEVVSTGINIGITIVGLSTIKFISRVAMEITIGLCFLLIIDKLLVEKVNYTNQNWILVTICLLIVSLILFKNIQKRNERFNNWINIISDEFNLPQFKLIKSKKINETNETKV